MNEQEKEKLSEEQLRIRTAGRDDTNADAFRYPYEPTPYCVLERLANSGFIDKNNKLIDYGCGKGRVGFFLSYYCKCQTIGVEFDKRLYDKAIENSDSCVSGRRTEFVNINAQEYIVGQDVDRFYFFNPFSIEILRSVMEKILDSYYEHPRRMLLFFYFPSDEYVSYLMDIDELNFLDEISCMDLFTKDQYREVILVFECS